MSDLQVTVKVALNLAALELAEHPWDVFARVRSVKEFKTRDGRPFLILELADAHRAWDAKIWDDKAEAQEVARGLTVNAVVKLRALVEDYEDRLQLKIIQLRPADGTREPPEYDPSQLFDPALALVEDLVAATLVFDIETVPGVERRELPGTVHEALTQYAERKEMEPDKAMSLSPYFGRVISLAVADGDSAAGQEAVTVLFAPPEGVTIPDPPPWLRPMSEADLLRSFWALAGNAQVVVSFNGKGFDVPFLVARSMVHGIPARVDLLSQHRHALRPHLDLWELLGRDRGPSKLDVICWALGIESPKEQMDGSMVAPAYAQGEYVKIAHYNAHDVRATCAVYRKARDLILRYRSDWSR